jgi:hypothetical protein
MLSNIQFIYQSEPNTPSEVNWLWAEEAKIMESIGISVSTFASNDFTSLLYRGGSRMAKFHYNNDSRFINDLKHVNLYRNMSSYLPLISDLSIETFFVNGLDGNLDFLINERGWERAFIKKDVKSLEHIEIGKSFYPDTSFAEMKKLYDEMQIEGKYAVRKVIEEEIIEKEERYWVLNGNVYHRHDKVPKVVKEAAKRLNKLGSRYYTIDATTDFIVEVNPGESSDRHAVNSAELFASWFKKEFVK